MTANLISNAASVGSKMIYLFNSAYKPTYAESLYRLAGLPRATRVDMRYTQDVNAPGIKTDANFKNSECVICYVDRFVNEYVYYPFRKGIIRSIKREQGRVFYSIELVEHCHSYSPTEFTKFLQTEITNCPRLTNADPTCGEDGLYCVAGPDPEDLVVVYEDSWSEAVDQLYGTTSFRTGMPALFLVDIERGGKKPKGSKGGLELYANIEYELSVFYKYPIDPIDSGRRRLLIRMGTEINRELSVGSVADRMVIPISLPPLDFSAGAIIIETSVEDKGSTGGEVHYTATIPFRTQAWRSNILLFGLLFLVSFFDEFRKVGWIMSNADAWLSTLFGFLKFAIVVWAVFKYRGKLTLPGL